MSIEQMHDYGYDMAHEVTTMPQQRRGSSRPLVRGLAPRDLDPDTDFGHDQPHER